MNADRSDGAVGVIGPNAPELWTYRAIVNYRHGRSWFGKLISNRSLEVIMAERKRTNFCDDIDDARAEA